MSRKPSHVRRAKELRQNQTPAEGLLWSILRTKQLCGLKFRRQHSIQPYFVDFACEGQMLIVELDGGVHDEKQEEDLERQRFLESLGWRVIRFANEDVLEDAEAVAMGIAKYLDLPYEFRQRNPNRSGEMSENRPPPGRYSVRPPRGEVK